MQNCIGNKILFLYLIVSQKASAPSLTITPKLSKPKQINLGTAGASGPKKGSGNPAPFKKQTLTTTPKLSGITVSKVSSGGAESGGFKKSSLVQQSRSSSSAAAVESAKEILAQERSKKVAANMTPAQEAYAKLKSFRTSLPNTLKRTAAAPSTSSTAAKKPALTQASSKVTVDDDDVICID